MYNATVKKSRKSPTYVHFKKVIFFSDGVRKIETKKSYNPKTGEVVLGLCFYIDGKNGRFSEALPADELIVKLINDFEEEKVISALISLREEAKSVPSKECAKFRQCVMCDEVVRLGELIESQRGRSDV